MPVTPRDDTGSSFASGCATTRSPSSFGLGSAFVEACRETWKQTKTTFEVVGRLLTARLSPKNMMGPLGIARRGRRRGQDGARRASSS